MSNAIAAVLLASLAVWKQAWYHAVIALVVTAIFLSFIVSSALELR